MDSAGFEMQDRPIARLVKGQRFEGLMRIVHGHRYVSTDTAAEITNSPAMERVSALCVAAGIWVTDRPTPSPPMQQDAPANRAGSTLLVRIFSTSLDITALETVSANRNKSPLPLPVHAAKRKPLPNATRIKTRVRQNVETAMPITRGKIKCRNGSPPSASTL